MGLLPVTKEGKVKETPGLLVFCLVIDKYLQHLMCGIAVDSPLTLSSLPIVQFFLIKNEFVNKIEIKLYIKERDLWP